jgi:hypothetical protein
LPHPYSLPTRHILLKSVPLDSELVSLERATSVPGQVYDDTCTAGLGADDVLVARAIMLEIALVIAGCGDCRLRQGQYRCHEESICQVREQVGESRVVLGLLWLHEGDQVMATFAEHMGVKVLRVDAEDRFPKALRGVSGSSLAWMEQKSYTWVRSLELLLTDTHLDLFDDRIDVAVRLGALQDNKLVTTKLCDIPYIVCASPEYLRRFGTPEKPTDLEGYDALCLSLPEHNVWRLRDAQGNVETINVHYLKDCYHTELHWN